MTNKLFSRAIVVCLLALTFVSATRAQNQSIIPAMCFDPTTQTASGTLVLNPPVAASVSVPVPFGRYRVTVNPGGPNQETVIGTSTTTNQVSFVTANTHTAGETVLVQSDGNAVMGYNNPNSTTSAIQAGFPDNYFTPGSLRYPGQTTSFQPGVHENILRLSVLNGDALTWVLLSAGVSNRASLNRDNICGTINYQGRLSQNGNLANGSYSMRFQAYDAETGGTAQGPAVSVANVTVTNGIFTVPLQLGSSARNNFSFKFLEIGVRPASAPTNDPYTTLAPRQPITSVPYAINATHARTADSAASSQNVTGTVSVANGGTGSTTQNFLDLTTNQSIGGNKTFSGVISGDGSGLTNLNTPTASNFLFSYNTASQNIATANTFQNVTFNTNGQINGWTHTPGSATFTVPQNGIYLVTYKLNFLVTSAATTNYAVSGRLASNGTEIPGSVATYTDAISAGQLQGASLTHNVIVNATSGTTLQLQIASTLTTTGLDNPTPHGTTKPNATMTIVRIQ